MTKQRPGCRRRAFLRGAAFASGLFLSRRESAAAPEGRSVNLLFIITDQQRWDALGRAGNTVLETPHLDRLADQGAYFENAFTLCPVCAPARTSILTGCSIETTGVGNNKDADLDSVCSMTTFDELLADQGYWTGYLGKWHAPIPRGRKYKTPVRAGGKGQTELGQGMGAHYKEYLDEHVPIRKLKAGEQYDTFSHRPYRADPIDKRYGLPPGARMYRDRRGREKRPAQPDIHGGLQFDAQHSITALQARATLDALEDAGGGPFSLTCSFHFPHAPMTPTIPYYGMYPPASITPPASIDDPMDNSPYRNNGHRLPEYADHDKIRYMISNYYGLVKEIDDWVGKILAKLDAKGLTDNTLVIFTSDHGEMLGAHGMREKNVFYEESLHIPLIMRLPGVIPAGTVISHVVSQIDLYETILDYTETLGPPSEGRSLRDLIENGSTDRPDFIISEWDAENQPNYMVRTADWKYITARTPESKALDALYDLKNDPNEMNNLLGNNPEKHHGGNQARAMKARLVQWLKSIDSPYLDGVKARGI